MTKLKTRFITAFALITGIKGIANASAIHLLAELMILPHDMTAKQGVAYAGLNPRQFESASSVAKKPRLSKAGNKFIRQALYTPALVATRYETHIKASPAFDYRQWLEKNSSRMCRDA
ncbi:MAG: IS110 family transposase [Methylococcales bacterium]|nr:IS110 family transposase [Methylococcales bacterium]